MPSQVELEDDMSHRTWCDRHPYDCARVQKQQEREWLHNRDIALGPLDIVASAIITGVCIWAML